MKQNLRFNHQQYLKELEGVQMRLERVRSNSQSRSQMNRSSSRKGFEKENDIPSFATRNKDYSSTNYLYKNIQNRDNLLTKTKPKSNWNVKNHNITMLGESTKLDRCITNIKNKVQQLSLPKEQSFILPCDSLKMSTPVKQTKQLSDNIFVQKLSTLYKLPESSSTLEQIIKQVELRDRIYNTVQCKFPHQDPSNYQNKLSQCFKRQQLLVKIIDTFKVMSKVDIEDYQQLYDFLKDQQ